MEAALFVVLYGLILFGWSTFGSFGARPERGARIAARSCPLGRLKE
jgi:hypothetical protein